MADTTKISQSEWLKYIERLRKINDKASDDIRRFVSKYDSVEDIDRNTLVDYAYGVATKYGEGAASLSAEMYEAVAMLEGKRIKPAEVADTPTISEVAKTVNGIIKQSDNTDMLASGVGRLVKRTGVDTVMKNALRDGAEWAWIPVGDTCAFCIMLASQGWVKASRKAIKNGHAEHIHANCDCTYAVRFDSNLEVEGYDPEEYRKIYYKAEGNTPNEKLNFIRRMQNVLQDEYIHKSVGAKTRSYDIMDLKTGEIFHLAEGTYLRNKEIFAGKGSNKPYKKAEKFANKYGGDKNEWMHVKGYGTIDTEEGYIDAEIHWSECKGIGKVELFVKRWLDES